MNSHREAAEEAGICARLAHEEPLSTQQIVADILNAARPHERAAFREELEGGTGVTEPQTEEGMMWKEASDRNRAALYRCMDRIEALRNALARIEVGTSVDDIHGEYTVRRPLKAEECRCIAGDALRADERGINEPLS